MLAILLLHLVSTRLVLAIDTYTASTGSESSDSSDSSGNDDEASKPDTLDECLCDPPDPQIPCEIFRGGPQEVNNSHLDPELGIPRQRISLLLDFLNHPDRELTGPHGLNLPPHVSLMKVDTINSLLRLFTLDQVVRHLSKLGPASLPSNVKESMGWCREVLKSQRYVNIVQNRVHKRVVTTDYETLDNLLDTPTIGIPVSKDSLAQL